MDGAGRALGDAGRAMGDARDDLQGNQNSEAIQDQMDALDSLQEGAEALAEAMILAELDRFLGVVSAAFDARPDDLVGAIEAAARGVLEQAQGNDLLKAVVSATHGADTELLPLLTTHAESLLAAAKLVVAERVAPYDVGLDDVRLEAAIDMVVRVVLSHVMQPSATPEATAADLSWIAARVLRG